MKAEKSSDEEIENYNKMLNAVMEALKNNTSLDAVKEQIRKDIIENFDEIPEKERKGITDKEKYAAETALEQIMRFGGFPEPFLKGSEEEAKRWRRSHVDRILREDLPDMASVRNVRGLETLVELLRHSVGSAISYESLSRDLQVSPHTVKQWIGMLESLYILFVITPYSRNIGRSLLKQPKIYFYDTGFVKEDAGARFENAVACALLKHLHFLEGIHIKKASGWLQNLET